MSARSSRLSRRFSDLADQERAALVTFVTAGDPDPHVGAEIVAGLPAAGADIIELGMPFSDPMADGPTIQAAGERALRAGQTMERTLDMVAEFRQADTTTPIVLMGYYNPIYSYGVDRFLARAGECGVDGLIIVDLPPEEDDELCLPSAASGIDFIRLVAPTTDTERLRMSMANASGFVYYVSITGITGTSSAQTTNVAAGIDRLRGVTTLPIAVGFGVKTPQQASAIAEVADGVVVGSSIVQRVADGIDGNGRVRPDLVDGVHSFVADLAAGVRQARQSTNTE